MSRGNTDNTAIGARSVAVLPDPIRHRRRLEGWVPYREQLDALGALPNSVHVSVWDGRGPTPGDPAQVEVWVPPFSSGPDVVAHLRNLTGLRLLQLMSAGVDVWIDHLPKGVTLCDARGVHTGSTSEWVVDGRFLARMRDGALLVNAARGPVVDTAALLAELQSRRLRAALDVTDPEPLPADHPLWDAPGLLLAPHVGGSVHGLLAPAYELVGDQLRRYAAGESLKNVVTDGY